MRKIGLGIAILLFSILFQLCSAGMDAVSLVIGVIGLVIAIWGAANKSSIN